MSLGDSIVTITEAVERYMALAGRNSPSHKAQYLIRGLEIWKDIRSNILRVASHTWVTVDKSKLPYRAYLPKCASKFINVGGINNCDEFKSYGLFQGMHAVDYEEVEPCNCDESISECITTSESTEEIIEIDGEDYTKTVTTTVCSNGDVNTKTVQPVQRLDAQGNPVYEEQKTFDFAFDMLVVITAIDPSLYSDAAVPSDLLFHTDGVGSDIHYLNGMYSAGVSQWANDSIGDMFRTQFRSTDVGVAGYSNRGINEIGGNVANTQAAYDSWRAQLEAHVYYQLFTKMGIVVTSVEVSHVGTVTTASEITHSVNLKVTMPISSVDLDIMMLNSQSENEWSLTGAVLGSEWQYSDIILTTPPHTITANKIVLPPVAEVDMVTTESLLCNLEVDACGCIVVSQENLEIIADCCNAETVARCTDICQNYFTQPKESSLTRNEAGYYKFDEGKRTVFLYGDIPDQVLINHQTTGESSEDEVMPNYVLSTFNEGMDWINGKYSRTMQLREKEALRNSYWASKNELEGNLSRNKIDISKWGDQSIGIFVKW